MLAILGTAGWPAAAQGNLNSHESIERFIGPVPLPVSDYVGTFHVVEGRCGYTLITWSRAYRNHSDGEMKDEEVMGFICNALRVGLENVKSMLNAE